MADVSKGRKIAAAKKKLKQFQSKAKTDTKTFTAENETPENVVSANASANTTEPLMIEMEINHANSEPTPPPFQDNSNLNLIKLSDDRNEQNCNAMAEIPASQSTESLSAKAIEEIPPIQNYFNAEIHSNNIQPLQQQSQQQQFDDIRSQLEVERMKNHELNGKVMQQQRQIDDMNLALRQAYEHMQQMPAMKNNSDALQQTVDVLVKEKSDLTAKLQQKEQIIIEQDSGITELKSRLGASRHRVAELEKDLNTIKASHAKNNECQQGINSELDLLKTENERLKQLYQDVCSENTEIQHQLSKKIKSIGEIEQRFEAKCKELEMAQLYLQQLTSSSTLETSSLSRDAADEHNQQQSNTNRQIIELQNIVSELTNDRDASQQQYQTYVHHLNGEMGTLTQKNQELTKQIDKLSKREESLVDHVRELEKQIQKNISVQQRLTALEDNKPGQVHLDGAKTEQIQKELDDLRVKVAASEETKQQLNVQLQDIITAKLELEQQIVEKDTKLAELSAEIEKVKDECPNTSGVLATMESDKLAASKSMTQNQELKKQLDEIQRAYIQVSNDKLELTTQLQSEQYSANEIRQRFSGIEDELKTVKKTLFFKDEEMIRLAHENTHLTSELRKLEDKYKTDNEELSRKYTHAKREIGYLRKKLASLSKSDTKQQTPNTTVETNETNETNKSESMQTFDENSLPPPPNSETEKVELMQNENDSLQNNECSIQNNHLDSDTDFRSEPIVDSNDNDFDEVSVTSTINIATDEAMCKLQDRFKRTMTEIAELTEEKQRLEHLVLQLQSETETIGEYIALYQTQRRLLKQREVEKDIQLHRIAADREDMKNKLEKLNRLVEMLLISKKITNPEQIVHKNGELECRTNNSNDNCESHSHALPDDVQTPPLTNDSNCCHAIIDDGSSGSSITKSMAELPANTKETATQIINLLTEIKETNLNTDNSMVPYSLNHCPCCSGSLEIV